MTDWHAEWQNPRHIECFDFRASLNDTDLARHYEATNEIKMLGGLGIIHGPFVEVGCATGQMYRYMRRRYPAIKYLGMDISRSAIETAQQRFPAGAFACQAEVPAADVIFARDVAHHQPDAARYLQMLVSRASVAVI